MAQEIRDVDYESMVNKYLNEWEGCNLREFCFSEKVNIYRMLKMMKKMGVTKSPAFPGLKPLEISGPDKDIQAQKANSACHKGFCDDGCVHDVKLTCGKDVHVVIKHCSPEVLVRLINKMKVVC